MSPFEEYSPADVRDLIGEYPLAWVSAPEAGAEAASLLPLIGEYDADGRLTHLVGHFSRRNPLYAALLRNPRGLFLFTGPQSYLSPSDAGRRAWAPTWNYAQVRIEGDVAFEPHCTDEALSILVDAMESGKAEPWHPDELGGRYAGMAARIIGFRARVTTLLGRFKLGQDEDEDVLRSILDKVNDADLQRWMRRFNPGRAG